jgi:hypothetical protein
MLNKSAVLSAALVGAILGLGGAARPEMGKVAVVVRERGQAVPCRIHLHDATDKTPNVSGWPVWNDQVVCDANARLELPAREYRYEIERGPEYSAVSGELTVFTGKETTLAADLVRIADLASLGWWSGELHVHRRIEHVPLLMRAEDLHVAPVMTWWNKTNLWTRRAVPAAQLVRFDGNRFYHIMAGEDERQGGALLYFNLKEPLPIAAAQAEYPSPMRYLEAAREQARLAVHVDIEKPFWWDVPVWLASGQVDTVGIANNHMCRNKMYEDEAWGKPRDSRRLPPPLGNGYWTQEIYYHMLNCGLRIPPSAGSASGVLDNPLGYNRAYVHLDGEPTYERWFEGLRAGRTFVTNGPLLRVRAAGHFPGHVFAAQDKLEVNLDGVLEGRDQVEAIEIIRDGRVVRRVPAAEFARSGSLGMLTFTSSGWFLVRAIALNPQTFRFASTAPWYVEVGKSIRRVSRGSAQFFLDWTDERIKRVRVAAEPQREEVLQPHRSARQYWVALVAKATAD